MVYKDMYKYFETLLACYRNILFLFSYCMFNTCFEHDIFIIYKLLLIVCLLYERWLCFMSKLNCFIFTKTLIEIKETKIIFVLSLFLNIDSLKIVLAHFFELKLYHAVILYRVLASHSWPGTSVWVRVQFWNRN